MIEKHLRQFGYIDNMPGVRSVSLAEDVDSLVKSASSFNYEFSPEFLENIEIAKKKMLPSEILIATISVGDGEIYGPNINSDWFSTKTLDKIYKTFESGNTYIEHNNKDISLSVGRILYAFRNRKMRRIELLNTAEHGKADSWIRKINRGEPVDVSFGYKTPWDECSICHHKSSKRSEYCEHLSFQMNQTLPDGRKVFAINPDIGRFFEISFVSKGAVPIARMMKKVARDNSQSFFIGYSSGDDEPDIPSPSVSDTAGEVLYTKSAGVKLAEMIKSIESNLSRSGEDPEMLKDVAAVSFPFSQKHEKRINPNIFKGYGLGDVLSNLGEAGIVPSHEEFASILSSLSLRVSQIEKAVQQIKDGCVSYDREIPGSGFLNIVSSDSLRNKMLHSGLIENRSWHGPRVVKRIIIMAANPSRMVKTSSSANLFIPALATSVAAGQLYSEYLKRVAPTKLSMLESRIKKNPKIAMALLFSSIMLPHILTTQVNYEYARSDAKKPSMFPKTSAVNDLVKSSGFLTHTVLPTVGINLASAHLENKKKQGEQLGFASNLLAEHPLLSSAAAVGAIYKGKKLLPKLFKGASISFKEASDFAINAMALDMKGIPEFKEKNININIGGTI